MRNLIQQWLNDEIDGDITVNGRNFTLQYDGGRYEVYEADELVAHTDNAKDFLNVGLFLQVEPMTNVTKQEMIEELINGPFKFHPDHLKQFTDDQLAILHLEHTDSDAAQYAINMTEVYLSWQVKA